MAIYVPDDFTFYTVDHDRQYRATKDDSGKFLITDWKPLDSTCCRHWEWQAVERNLSENLWKIVDDFSPNLPECPVGIEDLF